MPNITLNISVAKYPTFKRWFLLTHPNQTLDSGKPLTDDQWINYRILLFARGAAYRGQDIEEKQEPVRDPDIITES
jgi:hypothetical protein